MEKATSPFLFTDREYETILAALRFWQCRGHEDETEAGNYDTLTPIEIDELCEAINCRSSLRMVVAIEGGLVTSVAANDPGLIGISVAVIDYDVDGADEDSIIDVPQPNGKSAKAQVHLTEIEPAEENFTTIVHMRVRQLA